jgi:hypothetical protein
LLSWKWRVNQVNCVQNQSCKDWFIGSQKSLVWCMCKIIQLFSTKVPKTRHKRSLIFLNIPHFEEWLITLKCKQYSNPVQASNWWMRVFHGKIESWTWNFSSQN